jgi:pantothenate kinase
MSFLGFLVVNQRMNSSRLGGSSLGGGEILQKFVSCTVTSVNPYY